LSAPPRVLPVGDAAASLELGRELEPGTNARVRAFDEALRNRPFAGFLESVPSYRSLLVLFDPGRCGFEEVRDELLALTRTPVAPVAPGRLVEVPVVYGGEAGPDLAALAAARGLSEAEAVARHAGAEYTAFMLGFTPGFAYLGLLPEELEMPRHATPRVRVPAGSVATAGRQTGIYPAASPGGWNLIGRTSLRLFDPQASRPTLIEPGDRVRFRSVTELPAEAPLSPGAVALGAAAVEVLDPGLFTTVQDAGRSGYRRLGIAGAGALDATALELANRSVGNAAAAAGLELTLAGPTLRFLRPVRFALAGADLGAVLQRADLGDWPVPSGVPVLARPGNRLVFRQRLAGCRAYLAFAGGIDVPRVLGSRSTDRLAGFGGLGGRPLAAGDRLGVGAAVGPPRDPHSTPPPRADEETVRVRVVLGPQLEDFAESTLRRFCDTAWSVGSLSDRVGCRLQGEPLAHTGTGEIASEGMVPGSVQVPPDGLPIVMLADAPTTGGYPKVATVLHEDLPLLAQLVPGAGRVRFVVVENIGGVTGSNAPPRGHAPSPPSRSARE